MQSKIVLILLPFILLSSCLFEDNLPTIKEYYPKHHSIVEKHIEIKIKFSKKMNIHKTAGAFSITLNNENVAGQISWTDNDKTMVFKPELPFSYGSYYKYIISTDAEDSSGNNITNMKSVGFFVGDDLQPPEINSFYPSYNNSFPLDGKLKIQFSKEMNKTSVERAFSLSPANDGYFSWNSDSTILEYITYNRYEFRQVYNVKVSSNAEDINGIKFISDNDYFFIAGEDFEKPYLLLLKATSCDNPNINWISSENYTQFQGLEQNTNLTLLFNENINKKSLEKAISFVPVISYNVLWNTDNKCQIIFSSFLNIDQKYELRINNEVMDLEGNHVENSYMYYFVVNGTNTRQPDITSLIIDDANTFPSSETLIENTITNIQKPGIDYYYIRITFDEDINKYTFPGSISIKYLNGINTTFKGAVKSILWEPASSSVVVVKLSAISDRNTYKLTLKGNEGNITSVSGNPMKGDKEYIFYVKE